MTNQGFDSVTYSCGRCSHRFEATTEAEYVALYAAHVREHLDAPATPEELAYARTLRAIGDFLSAEVRKNGRITVRQIIADCRRTADNLEKKGTPRD